MSKKAINKSVKKSVEYSIALAFSILLLATSIYSLPTASASRFNSEKNSNNSLSRIEGSYKRYCVADESTGLCFYVLVDDFINRYHLDLDASYGDINTEIVSKETIKLNPIRAPPVV